MDYQSTEELELKELMAKVMAAPLMPLIERFETLEKQIKHIEKGSHENKQVTQVVLMTLGELRTSIEDNSSSVVEQISEGLSEHDALLNQKSSELKELFARLQLSIDQGNEQAEKKSLLTNQAVDSLSHELRQTKDAVAALGKNALKASDVQNLLKGWAANLSEDIAKHALPLEQRLSDLCRSYGELRLFVERGNEESKKEITSLLQAIDVCNRTAGRVAECVDALSSSSASAADIQHLLDMAKSGQDEFLMHFGELQQQSEKINVSINHQQTAVDAFAVQISASLSQLIDQFDKTLSFQVESARRQLLQAVEERAANTQKQAERQWKALKTLGFLNFFGVIGLAVWMLTH